MIAKHKIIPVSFKVIESGEKSFSGKVIASDDKSWKINQIYRHLDKSQFNLIIDWSKYDNLYVSISNVRSKLLSL